MTTKRIAVAAVAALLLAAAYFAAFGGHEARRQPPKPPEEKVVQPAAPAAPATEKTARPAETDGETPAGRMRLSPAARETHSGDTAELSAGVTYSLKKERDREIAPGVTYSTGDRSVNIQLSNKDESLRLKRGGADAVGDYQVMWQKKY
jgi:pyruvate/2-oxoglutarate dehydrogenase complex dihydrolipoamide acyltransferase (E2) component